MHPLEEKEEKTRKKKWMRTRDIEKKPNYYKRYKLHPCPNCNKLHRGLGVCCSQACANANREITDQMRLNQSASIKKYLRSPEGIATKKRSFSGIKKEDHYITIPFM